MIILPYIFSVFDICVLFLRRLVFLTSSVIIFSVADIIKRILLNFQCEFSQSVSLPLVFTFMQNKLK